MDASNNVYVAIQAPSGTTGLQAPRVQWLSASTGGLSVQPLTTASVSSTWYGTVNTKTLLIQTGGVAPAPLTGQTHSYGTVTNANVTLDTCNLYETRYATGILSVSSGTYYVYLPSGGTYQYINTVTGTTAEVAGGTAILSVTGPTGTTAFNIIYRRIA
jgi:hypothetical protein